MHIRSKKALRDFWENPKNSEAEKPLLEWYHVVRKSRWNTFAEVRQTFNSADQYGRKTIFNIGGNKYRLIAVIDFELHILYVRAVLTHKEYDKAQWKKDIFGDDWKPILGQKKENEYANKKRKTT